MEGRAVDIRPGDLLEMKKTHPCGGKTFLVLRAGMDFKLRCVQCGREFMAPRRKMEKHIRTVTRDAQSSPDTPA